MDTFYAYVTAHDPLARFDSLLEVLRGYQTLPGSVQVFIYVDAAHIKDIQTLEDLLKPNLSGILVYCIAANPCFTGFSLTWAHKQDLRRDVKAKKADFYIYSENDMVFGRPQFDYWVKYKPLLEPFNLEPGFCRYETHRGDKIPFDNYRVWQLNRPTLGVWGDRPYLVQTHLALSDPDVLGFVSLGNPYMGMMILDQHDAEVYIRSASSHPELSYALTAHRNWPIADRSSMGLAFEELSFDQEHRRVVPVVANGKRVKIPDYGLIEHKDTKYSELLASEQKSLITVDTMFEV